MIGFFRCATHGDYFLVKKSLQLKEIKKFKNPNRVFGREELFERVWGLDALGDSDSVTVHIARIREKIESDPSNPQYVETVWGAGYRFGV